MYFVKKIRTETKENTRLESTCLVNQNIYDDTPMLYKNFHSLAFKVSLHVWFYNKASDLTTEVYISSTDNNQTITSSKSSMANMVD